MIIGINGKIGSGKDTVGKIIQYLTSKQATSKGSYSHCEEMGLVYIVDWEIKKFAGKLKTIASILTGIPIEMFEDQEFKKSYLGEHWAKTPVAPLSDATLFDAVDLNNLMTYREFLQKLGTEAMRDGLHTNVWVNALFADYKCEHEIIFDSQRTKNPLPVKEVDNDLLQYPNWIITDMRFPNEMDAVELREGITIRVVRQYSKEDLCKGSSPSVRDEALLKKLTERYKYMSDLPVVNIHPSETALDDAKFDYEIINDGTIEDLVEKVREVLIKENII
jgi:hypothetical protein